MQTVMKRDTSKIYTRDEATIIAGLCEEPLLEAEISVPSPEDDDRDPEDDLGLYGSPYSDLQDGIEAALIAMCDTQTSGSVVDAAKEAQSIVELFDGILSRAGVFVDHPDLAKAVEAKVSEMLGRLRGGAEIVRDYSGTI